MRVFNKFVMAIALSACSIISASATELPADIAKYIKTAVPNSTIRFDGLVEFPNGTRYIPVLPMSPNKTDNPAAIAQTLPVKKNISAEPDMILFANNTALLKVIKQNGFNTVTSSPSLPLMVKMGIFPQDLIVPENFVLPSSMRVLCGDLKIPVRDLSSPVKTASGAKFNGNIKPVGYTSFGSKNLNELASKKIYSIYFNSNIIHNLSIDKDEDDVNTIELSSIPNDIKITGDTRYMLVSMPAVNSVGIIDLSVGKLIKTIPALGTPTEIVIDSDSSKAYVADARDSNLMVIDLLNMAEDDKIPTLVAPHKITLSHDDDTVYYSDVINGKIFKLSLSEPEKFDLKTGYIAQIDGISKIAEIKDKLLVLSRNTNSLYVFDTAKNLLLKKITLDEKPVDMQVSNTRDKVYVVSANTNSIQVIDGLKFQVEKTIKLNVDGFPKSLAILDTGDIGMISYVNSNNVALVDLFEEQQFDILPASGPSSVITVSGTVR